MVTEPSSLNSLTPPEIYHAADSLVSVLQYVSSPQSDSCCVLKHSSKTALITYCGTSKILIIFVHIKKNVQD